MKKRLLYITTLLMLASTTIATLSAQQYKSDYQINRNRNGEVVRSSNIDMVYGVMTGVNIPIMRDKQHDVKSEGSAGFMLGVRWGVDLGGFEIVPEFWYLHDKMTLNNPNLGIKGDLRSNSFEAPIVLGINIGERLRVNFGPSFALTSDAELDYEDETIEFGSYKSTFGYLIGLSYTAWDHFVMDLRYSGRFVSSKAEWPGNEENYDYRYYSVSITAGYRF